MRTIAGAAAVLALAAGLSAGSADVGLASPVVTQNTAPTVPTLPTTARKPVVTTKGRSDAARTTRTTRKTAKPGTATTRRRANGFGMGSRGDDVAALQTRLKELKYDISDVEGQYGGQTYHAVMAFQKFNGLDRSGRATLQTLAALETATAPVPMVPDGGPDRIEIDLQRQTLALYHGGELDRLLSISSGTGERFCALDPETGKQSCDVAVTPAGSFRVQSRIFGYRESRLGLLYNPLYFNGGIAIHGSASVPAGPASHGCVRIPMVSAEWFPNEVGDGTPVYVSDGKKTPTPLKQRGTSGSPKGATSSSTSTTSTTTTSPAIANPLGGSSSVPPATAPSPAPQTSAVPATAASTASPTVVSTTTTVPGSVRLLVTTTTTPPAPGPVGVVTTVRVS